jgi:hypothetical protein
MVCGSSCMFTYSVQLCRRVETDQSSFRNQPTGFSRAEVTQIIAAARLGMGWLAAPGARSSQAGQKPTGETEE